jgi:hypothetical protein
MTTATATPSTLFSMGWKAEHCWGDEITAHHMNTRSVYTFKANPSVSITHSAPYDNNGHSDISRDLFRVSVTTVIKYHESGTVAHSETKTVKSSEHWLSAYYCALDLIRDLNQ